MQRSDKPSREITLARYLPDGSVPYVVHLLKTYPVRFRIVRPRKSKLGDFRVREGEDLPEITVNGDLNPYSFLITTVHEFAHLKTWMEYRFSAAPHGKEWKHNFVELMLPVLQEKRVPKDIEDALMRSFTNVKASSCTDQRLHRVLRRYDSLSPQEILLEQLSKNSTFALRDKLFAKGELRRTRYLCKELATGKMYLVNALATVKLVELHEKK